MTQEIFRGFIMVLGVMYFHLIVDPAIIISHDIQANLKIKWVLTIFSLVQKYREWKLKKPTQEHKIELCDRVEGVEIHA